jgi:LVIVD repeat
MARLPRFAVVLLVLAGSLAGPATSNADQAPAFDRHGIARASATWAPSAKLEATPRPVCGPGSRPETGLQGRVPSNSPAAGFTCNTSLVGHEGKSGGFKVMRFVDRAGHECAYYDTTLLFPTNAENLGSEPTGVAVLDMANPAKPVRTATLVTPAMQSPHESLLLNERRGLLAAVLGNPAAYPGDVDIYDLNADCRHPALQASAPVGVLGHESGFAPDGKTFYATSLGTGQITAVDVTNPKAPVPLWVGQYPSHGLTISDDGNRAYVAARQIGLQIVDVSQIQARKPNPQDHEISRLTWPVMTIPQVALPVTIGGRPFLVEIDEFAGTDDSTGPSANGSRVGAARIIDISDEKAPKVVSDIRLAVHQPENRAQLDGDPGGDSMLQGYAGHYCNVPQRTDPGIVACSFIASGLRVFDIRDPYHPREIAYFTTPPSNYAMSSPAFVPARGEIWYADGNSGFYALRVTNAVWPFAAKTSPLGLPGTARCASRRVFSIHLREPKGRRLRSARVYVGTRRVAAVRGRRLRARVDLRGLPKGLVRVRIVAVTRSGRTITETRRYRTCTPR